MIEIFLSDIKPGCVCTYTPFNVSEVVTSCVCHQLISYHLLCVFLFVCVSQVRGRFVLLLQLCMQCAAAPKLTLKGQSGSLSSCRPLVSLNADLLKASIITGIHLCGKTAIMLFVASTLQPHFFSARWVI